jgi:hypothetical protein
LWFKHYVTIPQLASKTSLALTSCFRFQQQARGWVKTAGWSDAYPAARTIANRAHKNFTVDRRYATIQMMRLFFSTQTPFSTKTALNANPGSWYQKK